MGCWAMRESKSDPNTCTFDWIMCLDLKGRFPRFVLDKVSETQATILARTTISMLSNYGFQLIPGLYRRHARIYEPFAEIQ